jgi:hypothetical protein
VEITQGDLGEVQFGLPDIGSTIEEEGVVSTAISLLGKRRREVDCLAKGVPSGGFRGRLMTDADWRVSVETMWMLTFLKGRASDGPHVRGCWVVDLELGKE